jgi:LytTr DNA-binding domain
LEEFGEVYKLVADGPYCELHFLAPSPVESDTAFRARGEVKVLTKTLKCLMEYRYSDFIRLNRKIAIRPDQVWSLSGVEVTLRNGETFKFSRRRFKQFNQTKQ